MTTAIIIAIILALVGAFGIAVWRRTRPPTGPAVTVASAESAAAARAASSAAAARSIAPGSAARFLAPPAGTEPSPATPGAPSPVNPAPLDYARLAAHVTSPLGV